MQQHPSTTVYSPTNYSYDARGNLIQVNQSTSPTQTRRFAYDGLSRLIRASNPEQVSSSDATFTLNGQSWAVRYDYDLSSNLIAKTDTRPADSGFVAASYSYDNLNRISTRSYNDGTPTVTYSYDTATRGIGRMRSVITIGISTYNYTIYDAIGRLTHYNQQTDGQTYFMSAAYNKAGLMTSETYPSNRVVATEYDGAGRIAGVRNQSTGQYYAGASASDATNRLQYTAHGALSRMKLGNGLWEHTNFNPRLQPTRIGLGTTGTSTSLLGLDYDYGATNNNGNLLTQTINAPGLSATQGYTYDHLNRLLTAQESVGGVRWAQTFGYDQFGNRISLINTGVDAPSLPPPQAHPVTASTNRFTNFTYDAAGNVRTDHTGNTFSYDAESKQITSSVAGAQASYSYDGDGRRVKRVVSGVATIFVYNARGQQIAEYGGAASGESGASYLTTDHLGSTRVVTNESGGVRARHDYLPFGEEIPANVGGRQNVAGYAATDGTRQRFTSKERDTESGLDYFGARYYSSAQGRFTSVDPLRASAHPGDPQSWNRYTYALNRVTVAIDPDGLATIVVTVNPRSRGGTGRSTTWLYTRGGYFARYGKSNGEFQTLSKGAAGSNRAKTNADTPFGVYQYRGTQEGASDSRKLGPAYGTGKIIMDPVAGEVKESGRDQIRFHGGGSSLKEHAFDPEQPLVPTQGCVRCKNQDVNTLIDAIKDLEKQGDPVERIFIGDAQYLNNLAGQKGKDGSYLYPDLRLALGIDKPSKEERGKEKKRARKAAKEQE
jgi:RHS repeat-associated protein